MSDTILSLPEPTTEADYEAAIERLLKEIRAQDAHMNHNRTEIDRLQAETKVIADHTDTVLSNIWKQLDSLRQAN